MNREEYRKEIGKYFLDISKLVFGGVVLATILKIEDVPRFWVLVVGSIVTLISAYIGFQFLNYKRKK